jgi:predicted dehydrogenase
LYDSEEGPAKVWQPVWPSTLLFDPEFSGFVGEIKQFCDAVAGRCDSLCPAIEGYRALEVACALHRSYETKSTVSLPLRNF